MRARLTRFLISHAIACGGLCLFPGWNATAALVGWGLNDDHQINERPDTRIRAPAELSGDGMLGGSPIVALATGHSHSLALTAAGQVWAWGMNNLGQLGNGTNLPSRSPVRVGDPGELTARKINAIASGDGHCVALTDDGDVLCWGNNQGGQLGSGPSILSMTPVAVDRSGVLAGKTIAAVAAGYSHTLALSTDGQIFAWGNNSSGQLGNSSTNGSDLPVLVEMNGSLAGTQVVKIAAGSFFSLALTADGKIFVWGDSQVGQAGDGALGYRTTPVAARLVGDLENSQVTAITAGSFHALALTADGRPISWGQGEYGQLGIGNVTAGGRENYRAFPEVVDITMAPGETFTAVEAGSIHSLFLTRSGRAFACGNSSSGESGTGLIALFDTLTPVMTAGALCGRGVIALSRGCWTEHVLALTVSSTNGLPCLAPVGPGVRMCFAGEPGRTYEVHRTEGLISPVNWTVVSSVTADSNGVITWLQPDPPSPSYWRAMPAP